MHGSFGNTMLCNTVLSELDLFKYHKVGLPSSTAVLAPHMACGDIYLD